jgi:hypothetical protein
MRVKLNSIGSDFSSNELRGRSSVHQPVRDAIASDFIVRENERNSGDLSSASDSPWAELRLRELMRKATALAGGRVPHG